MTKACSAITTTYLKDYTPPAYQIDTVELIFELAPTATIVKARLKLLRNTSSAEPLILNGKKLELLELKLDEVVLGPADYQVSAEQLIIPQVPANFVLEITTRINPQANTELAGLYQSKGIFCTQCEAEGFRRITYFLDRPDVMARYTTTIIADKTQYPILLSNGNCIAQSELDNNRHSVTWQDPFKKPSYLFALVAGDLECLNDKFITQSGRAVTLKIFSERGQIDKCQHAMDCVKQAMHWDEINYGREYDLDIFMIAAINDFNMGAMENKGLNIFNAKYILAKPDTATDVDFQNILLVVGHEYFHNWTGNRITCRDWFQLSLKEGLTVFREQEFTEDMTSAAVARIGEVRRLRELQFKEDGGPLAHPVQPDSYIEINNFYTMTVYHKGSEVIRMLKTLLGAEQFRKGMDLYFERYDGQAVTIQDFVNTFEAVSGRDLTQFRLWYSQAGTPRVTITAAYDVAQQTYTLNVKQNFLATPGQTAKQPLHFPLAMGLLNAQGQELPLQLIEEKTPGTSNRILEIKAENETFTFVHVTEKPLPSLLRNFSAPVKLYFDYTDDELYFLLTHDSDAFNRWEAGERIATKVMLALIEKNQQDTKLQLSDLFVQAFANNLQQHIADESFAVELLTLPSESYMGEFMSVIDVDNIHAVRQFIRYELASKLAAEFMDAYKSRINNSAYSINNAIIGQRRLKNTCLQYLMLLPDASMRAVCNTQLLQANNMTDKIAALTALSNVDCPERIQALDSFYQTWQNDSLVIDKWFAIQAASILPGALVRIKALMEHPAFDLKNPNRVRSVLDVFCRENLVQFHDKSGAAYTFLTDQILKFDKINPSTASHLVLALTDWRRYDAQRQALMQAQLQRIANTPGISKDVYEIASKSLG